MGDQTARAGAQTKGEGSAGGGSAADRLELDSGLMGRGRSRQTSHDDCQKALLIDYESIAAGAGARELSLVLGVWLTTL